MRDRCNIYKTITPDIHQTDYWYTNADINNLLKENFTNGGNAYILSALSLSLSDEANAAFKDILISSISVAIANDIPSIIPINISNTLPGNNNNTSLISATIGEESHHTLLIISSKNGNATLKYIDSLGNGSEDEKDFMDNPSEPLTDAMQTKITSLPQSQLRLYQLLCEVRDYSEIPFSIIFSGIIQQINPADCGPLLIANAVQELKYPDHDLIMNPTELRNAHASCLSPKLSVTPPGMDIDAKYIQRVLGLLESIGAEIDYVGKAVANLNALLSSQPSSSEIDELKKLFNHLGPVTQWSESQVKALKVSVNLQFPDALIMAGLADVQLAYDAYVENFNKLDAQHQIELLEKNCQVHCDQLSFPYLIKAKDAQYLSCFDEYGNKIKPNSNGNRPVQCAKALFFKANPDHDYIAPPEEKAISLFYTMFSSGQTIAAATGLIKISNISVNQIPHPNVSPQQNLQAYNRYENELYTGAKPKDILEKHPDIKQALHFIPTKVDRVIQVGYGLGDLCFREMLALVQMTQTFKRLSLEESFIKLFYFITSETEFYNIFPHDLQYRAKLIQLVAHREDSLYEYWLSYLATKSPKNRPLEFQQLDTETPEKNRRLWLSFVKNYGLENLARAISLLHVFPELMVNHNFADLADYPKLLSLIPKLWPNLEAKLCYETLLTWLEQIDLKHFSSLAIASLLSNPSDGKADNYRAEIIRNEHGQAISYRIMAIDNDNALVKGIVYSDNNNSNTNFFIHVFCILYFLPVMDRQIDDSISEMILAKPAALWLVEWLQQLVKQNSRYAEMIQQNILKQADLYNELGETKFNIPFMLDESTIIDIYIRIVSLQTALQKNKNITFNDLFKIIDPVLAKYYVAVKNKHPDPINAFNTIYKTRVPLEIMLSEYFEASPSVESIQDETIVEGLQFIRNESTNNHEVTKKVTIMQALEDLLSHVNFALYDKIPAYSLICELAKFPDLKPLVLKVPEETKAEWLHLAIANADTATVALLLKSGADPKYPLENGDTALHTFAENFDRPQYNDVSAIAVAKMLILHNNIPAHHENVLGLMPIFMIIKAAKRKPARTESILKIWAERGISLNMTDSKNHESALDRCIARNHPQGFALLIKYGASQIGSVETTMKFLDVHKNLPEIKEAKKILENQNPRFAYLAALHTLTLPKSSKPSESAIKIEGVFSGVRYIPEELAKLIFDKDGNFITQSDQMQQDKAPDPNEPHVKYYNYGKRTVICVQWQSYSLVIKLKPELPAIEYAVSKFAQMLMGHGTSYSEAFCVTNNKGKPYVLQISQHIAGDNFNDVVNPKKSSGQSIEVMTEKLRSLDHYRLSQFILLSLLVSFEDAQPANLILAPFVNASGKIMMQLVSIDNDHAFGSELKANKNPKLMPQLLLKCVAFCLDEMQAPLHPQAVQAFLSHDPGKLLRTWLKDLEIQAVQFEDLFVKKHKLSKWGNKNDPTETIIGMPFKTKMMTSLYSKFDKLQRELHKNPHIKALDLFVKILPIAGRYYREAFSDAIKPQTPRARFYYLVKDLYAVQNENYQTLTTGQDMLKSLQNEVVNKAQSDKEYGPKEAIEILDLILAEDKRYKEVLDEITTNRFNTKNNPVEKLLLLSSKEKLMAAIDWRIFTPERAQQFLTYFIGTPFTRISLKGFAFPSNYLINELIKNSPELNLLSLEHCVMPDDMWITLSKYAPNIEKIHIDLEDSRNICIRGTLLAAEKPVNLPHLRRLALTNCPFLQNISINSNNLQELRLVNCEALRVLDFDFTQLRHVKIAKCTELNNGLDRLLSTLNDVKHTMSYLHVDKDCCLNNFDAICAVARTHQLKYLDEAIFTKLTHQPGIFDLSGFNQHEEEYVKTYASKCPEVTTVLINRDQVQFIPQLLVHFKNLEQTKIINDNGELIPHSYDSSMPNHSQFFQLNNGIMVVSDTGYYFYETDGSKIRAFPNSNLISNLNLKNVVKMISYNDKFVITGHADGTIKAFRLSKADFTSSFTLHLHYECKNPGRRITDLSGQGNLFAAGFDDGTVSVYFITNTEDAIFCSENISPSTNIIGGVHSILLSKAYMAVLYETPFHIKKLVLRLKDKSGFYTIPLNLQDPLLEECYLMDAKDRLSAICALDEDELITCTKNGIVSIYNIKTEALTRRVTLPIAGVKEINLNSKFQLYARSDSELGLWNIYPGCRHPIYRDNIQGEVKTSFIMPNNRVLLHRVSVNGTTTLSSLQTLPSYAPALSIPEDILKQLKLTIDAKERRITVDGGNLKEEIRETYFEMITEIIHYYSTGKNAVFCNETYDQVSNSQWMDSEISYQFFDLYGTPDLYFFESVAALLSNLFKISAVNDSEMVMQTEHLTIPTENIQLVPPASIDLDPEETEIDLTPISLTSPSNKRNKDSSHSSPLLDRIRKTITEDETEIITTLQYLVSEGLPIDSYDQNGKTKLHIACENGQTGVVRWLISKGANINLPTLGGETAIDLILKHGHKKLLTYFDFQNGRKGDIQHLSRETSVHIRMWPPTYRQQEVPLSNAMMAMMYDPKNTNVGHISIELRLNGKVIGYVSLWPSTEASTLISSKGFNCTLQQDLTSEKGLPTAHVVLYSLDVAAMAKYYEDNPTLPDWSLGGDIIFNGNTYNCSGYVYKLLEIGGLFNNLLSKEDYIVTFLTPQKVIDLCHKAHKIESILYPEVAVFFSQDMMEFKKALISKSLESFTAFEKFMSEHPDIYFIYAKNFPNEFDLLSKQIHNNLMQSNREELYTYVKQLVGMDDDLIEEIIMLHKRGADLEYYDNEGYNALHHAIMNQSYIVISKLLVLFPDAVNKPTRGFKTIDETDCVFYKMQFFNRPIPLMPLDLAMKRGDKQIVELLIDHEGISNNMKKFTDDLFVLQVVKKP